MALETTPAPKANGLKTLLDTIVAPKEAFESIAAAPTWGWALAVSIILVVAANFLMGPAFAHGMTGDMAKQAATNPQLAQMSDEQRAGFAKMMTMVIPLFSIVMVPIILLIQAVIFLIFNAIGRGQAGFGKLWATACNICIIFALSQIVAAIITIVRGPDSFPTSASIQQALPSLALLAPGAGPKLAAFLATINPFVIWSIVLDAVALTIVARLSKGVAWGAAIVSYLFLMAPAVIFAR